MGTTTRNSCPSSLGWLLVLTLLVAGPTNADTLEDQLAAHLFAPDVIMRHQRAIGLEPEQREAVSQAVRSAQREILELQWQLEDAGSALIEVLAQPDPEDSKVLEKLEAILTTESKIKRRHILLLLEIRRVLAVDQRAALREAEAGDP
jgi:uncharacterized membrane protein